MSKDIKIEKVGVPQEFDGVSKIVTSSPDFFQATWIPEEETSLIGKLKIHRNGHYDADNFMVPVVSDGVETEKQIYGFSEITVDVPIKPPGIIGDIDIDIPPIDIDIPPIDIDIPPIDIDIPPIDIVIPPIDIEIPEFPTDIIDITHIDDNGNIIAITRQDLEDMDLTIEDIDGMIDPVLTIDDFGNIDIVDAFDTDLSGLEVIDLAIGDIDLKVDGLDDDGRTKFTDEYLPTSIELTVPPNKLVYHDGEPIDLTGAIVSAKYKGGTAVWANEKYPNGIIPLGELIIDPKTATKAMGKITSDLGVVMLCGDVPLNSSCYYSAYTNYGRPAYGPDVRHESVYDGGELKTGHVFGFTKHIKGENNYDEYDELWGYIAWDAKQDYWASEAGRFSHNGEIVAYHGPVRFGFDNLIINDDRNNKYVWMETDHNVPLNGKLEKFQGQAKEFAWTSVFGDKTACEISLSWHRPKDNMILSTSFEIAVSDE